MTLSDGQGRAIREALIKANIHYGMSAVTALSIINEVLGSTPEGQKDA